MRKIVQAAPGNIKSIEKVFKFNQVGARGPQGEKGDTGDTGPIGPQGPQGESGTGIDYANPIAVNTTSTITPNDGEYFVSTAKLLNITGTAGEVFEPAENAETSRIIWGLGSGLDLININVNTSGLGIGEMFEIAADNGESRRWIKNAAGDLEKKGGVIKPLECQVYHTGAAQITVPHNTNTPISTLGSTIDNSGQMHKNTGNGGIIGVRSGQYESHNRLGYTGVTSGTTHTIFSRMVVGAALISEISTFILSDNSVGVFTRASPPMVTLTAGNLHELSALQLDKGGTSSIKVHSSATGQEQRNYMHLIERNPY